MKARLKRDIIIPAGTIFDDAPRRVYLALGHVEHILGLTNDSAGSLAYFLDPDDAALAEWFEVLDAKGSMRPSDDERLDAGWRARKEERRARRANDLCSRCDKVAGSGTAHRGVGDCAIHESYSPTKDNRASCLC